LHPPIRAEQEAGQAKNTDFWTGRKYRQAENAEQEAGQAENTDFQVFGVTRMGIEPSLHQLW